MRIEDCKNRLGNSLQEALCQSSICDKNDKFEMVIIAVPTIKDDNDGENMSEQKVKILYDLCAEKQLNLDINDYKDIWSDPQKLSERILADIENLRKPQNMKMVQKEGKKEVSSIAQPKTTYHVLAAILVETGKDGYKDLFGYILKRILSKVNYINELLDFDNSKNTRERFIEGIDKQWVLLREYADFFLSDNNLPEAELLTELSSERYEGSESNAKIYFNDTNLETVEEFTPDEKEIREIRKGNIRMIRKLMEISGRGYISLYAEGQENKKVHIVSKLVREKNDADEVPGCQDLYLMFPGFMHWCIMQGDKELIGYYHGKYRVNYSPENETYIGDIENLNMPDEIKEMIKDMAEILRKQKHGTTVIVTDDTKEVDRLCQVYRGIRVASHIKYDVSKKWDEDQLLSITGIDGAVVMSLEGECLAIGVIVDGVAKQRGDIGRGARYNSIKNYVEQKDKGKYVGIIFSEDGMVNVVSNCKK